MHRQAMDGVKILDFTWIGVGAITTKYLADNGADVIRIESAARLDVLRLAPPWLDGKPGLNRSQFFASYNTSKKGITLNLDHPKARELIMRLLPWADAVTESFTPKAMRKWGLDYESLSQIRPDLVMLSTCLQGQTGPHALFPGYGQLMAALSGFYSISGYDQDRICPPYGAYTDFIAPRFAACALLAALAYRQRTGQGQHVDMAQYEAALHFLAPSIIEYFATGKVAQAQGNCSERFAPNGAYRCRDEDGAERWIAIAVATDEEWRALLTALGNPACDPQFETIQGRLVRPIELDRFLGEQIKDHAAQALTIRLQASGVAAYPVQNCMDVHQDENLAAFGFWHWLDHQEMGPSPYEGLQHRLERTPGELRWAAPVLGQHNEEILGGLLGLRNVEIEQLRKDKVIF